MSYTKFKTEDGTEFLYNNENNGLYDVEKRAISRPFQEPAEWDMLKDRFGKTTISKAPETIKVTLGHGCNYSCGYCMQKDIGDPSERPQNGLTPTLIRNIERYLDLNDLARFELWGGETLLYWKDMVEIMNAFDRKGITWYIPTNGTPLMHKHVDFLGNLKGTVAMGISHDGPAHESTRGKEFLHKKVDILRRIQEEHRWQIQYSFNPVISRTNYDLYEINDFFAKFLSENNLVERQLSYELGRVYDKEMAQNSTHHVINGENIGKYKAILASYLSDHTRQQRGETLDRQYKLLPTNLYHTGMGVIPWAKTLQEQKVPLLRSNCGVDDSKLISMDINGVVKTCQNTDDRYASGNIMHIKGIKIKSVNLNRDDHCGTCEVRRLCKSSCPLDLGPDVHNTNCRIEKTHYREIQRASFELLFKQRVEMVGQI